MKLFISFTQYIREEPKTGFAPVQFFSFTGPARHCQDPYPFVKLLDADGLADFCQSAA